MLMERRRGPNQSRVRLVRKFVTAVNDVAAQKAI